MSRFNFFLSSLFCTGFPLTETWVNKSNFHPSAVFKLHNFKVCKLVLWFQTTPLKGYKSFLTSLALSLHPFLPHCKATLPPSASVSSSLAPAPLEGVRGSWSKHTPAKAADSRRCSSCLRSRVQALVSRVHGCPFAGTGKPTQASSCQAGTHRVNAVDDDDDDEGDDDNQSENDEEGDEKSTQLLQLPLKPALVGSPEP